jgi:hypothetical protein
MKNEALRLPNFLTLKSGARTSNATDLLHSHRWIDESWRAVAARATSLGAPDRDAKMSAGPWIAEIRGRARAIGALEAGLRADSAVGCGKRRSISPQLSDRRPRRQVAGAALAIKT